jgi:hypothetical protein
MAVAEGRWLQQLDVVAASMVVAGMSVAVAKSINGLQHLPVVWQNHWFL